MQPTTIITGNLTSDPELRYLDSGRPVANFTIAHNPRRLDEQSGSGSTALRPSCAPSSGAPRRRTPRSPSPPGPGCWRSGPCGPGAGPAATASAATP